MGERKRVIKDPLIEKLIESKNYKNNIRNIIELEEIQPRLISLDFLNDLIQEKLKKLGITHFYEYQKEVYESIKNRENLAIISPTASGKTLSFHIPIYEFIKSGERAIYVYPTKALTRDQERQILNLTNDINIGVYDGDTDLLSRKKIRESAQILFTNPEMIHYSILPYHTNWSRFISRLSYVVFDEAHIYNGVFGSNVASLIRRMKRVFNFYERDVKFVFSSATVGNPHEFFENLFGEKIKIVRGDGTPRKKKRFVFIKTPDERSILVEAMWITELLINSDYRGIAFMRSRKGVELLYRYLKERLDETLLKKVLPYRAGYSKERRREIERKLLHGEINFVISTNALELGIDIGELDVVLIVGYPGTISSFLQESGRAGRKREGYTIFIADKDPLNEYVVNHPEEIFEKGSENLIIDPTNPNLLKKHILCASYEIPIQKKEEFFIKEICEILKKEEKLKEIDGRFIPNVINFPHKNITLRSFEEDEFILYDENGKELERIDERRAYTEAHPGAVYYFEGESYVVREVDIRNKEIFLDKKEVDYYTQSLELVSTKIIKTIENKKEREIQIFYGDLEVTSLIYGYQKRKHFTNDLIGEYSLDLPKMVFETKGLWFTINEEIKREIIKDGLDFNGSIHALEHLLIGVFPLIAICDRRDLGGLSHPIHSDTDKPTIFIYDAYPGGIGFSKKGFDYIEKLLTYGYDVIKNCKCEDGCPSCIYSPKCGNKNKPLDKKGAILILEKILFFKNI
ncbi:MAG: DEAD/DEAH box helicase [Caldisericia bacterium]|nr:DEAD/DEAH box helicase [Caldisericia bacterium]